jgi:RHS repeat-associated protein
MRKPFLLIIALAAMMTLAESPKDNSVQVPLDVISNDSVIDGNLVDDTRTVRDDKLETEGHEFEGNISLAGGSSNNVALGKPVQIASGSFNGVSVATLVDGIFLPSGTQWQAGTVWWSGARPTVEVGLEGRFLLDAAIVQTDDNDSYSLQYRNLQTGEWLTLWEVPNYSALGNGMLTRPNPADDSERFTFPVPILTDRIRFLAASGDNSYSVSEIQVFGMPECDQQLTFEEFPAETYLTNQYGQDGVLFDVVSGDLQITDAFPENFVPVSGDRVFGDPNVLPAVEGIIQIGFVVPGTSEPATTNYFSCYIIDAEDIGATVTAIGASEEVVFSQSYHGGEASQELVVIDYPFITRVIITLGQDTDTVAIDDVCVGFPYELVLIEDTVSREFSIFIGESGSEPISDASAREFSVYIGDIGIVPMEDTLSREISVFIGDVGTTVPDDAVARVFSVHVGEVGPVHVADSVAREFSVFVGEDVDPALVDAISREFSAYVASPDLLLDFDLSDFPNHSLTDEELDITFVVRNAGDGTANGSWMDRVYLSTDTTWSENELIWSNSINGPLAADEVYTGQFQATAPHLPGDYYLIVVVDADNAVEEAGDGAEANEFVIPMPIDVDQAPRANLRVASITPPVNAEPGSLVQVAWTIENNGNAPAIGPWEETVYGSSDDQIGGDIEGPPYSYSDKIPPDGSILRVEDYLVPPGIPPGEYWIVVCVDTGDGEFGDVIELNDSIEDNCAIELVCVDCLQPDFVVETVVSDSGAVAGATLGVSWTVRNSGKGEAVGAWADRVFLAPVDNPDAKIAVDNFIRIGPLLVDESYNATHDALVPIELDGDFIVSVVVDVQNNIAEPGGEGENNTCGGQCDECIACPTTTLTQPDLPDLALDDSSPQYPNEAFAGDSVTISWLTVNVGEVTAGGQWIDRVFLSTNDQLDPIDEEQGIFVVDGPIENDSSYIGTLVVDLPDEPGRYWFVVTTDANDDVEEGADDGNNVSVGTHSIMVLPPPRPDLVVQSINLPMGNDVLAGSTVTLEWMVMNEGPATAEGFWQDRIYLSDDAIPEDDEIVGQFYQYGPLSGVTGEYTASEQITLPFDIVGPKRFIVVTDVNNHLNEGEGEGNNILVALTETQVSQPDLPNLIPISVSVDAQEPFETGQLVQISWAVENSGEIPAETADGSWRDRVFASTSSDPGPGDLITLGTVEIDGPVETDYLGSGEFELPNLPGSYWVFVAVNIDGEVEEGIETGDNTARTSAPVGVVFPPRPNLVVDSITLPPPAAVGAFVDLAWTTGNNGQVSALGDWNERVYASPDNEIGNDQLLGTFVFFDNEVPPSEISPRNRFVTVPDLPLGFYYIVCTDSSGLIDETFEDDNCKIADAPIQPFLPDLVVSDVVAPTSALADEVVAITWQVTNQGQATVHGIWVDTIYLDPTDSNLNDISVGTSIRFGPLPMEVGYSGSQNITVPGLNEGEFQFYVVTDSLDVVFELNDNNNVDFASSTTEIQQPLRPNLLIVDAAMDLLTPPVGLIGGLFTLEYTVTNTGDAPALGAWSDRVMAVRESDDGEFLLEVLFQTTPVEPGESYTHSCEVRYPTEPGNYRLVVEIDTTNLVTEGLVESDAENDNVTLDDATFTVDGFNVTIDADIDSDLAGTPVHLRGTATLQGNNTPIIGIPVAIRVQVRNTSRVFTYDSAGAPIVTDENGEFDYLFVPLPNEGGQYFLAAGPLSNIGPISDEPDFVLYGIKTEPAGRNLNVFEGVPSSGTIAVSNLGDTLLTDLIVSVSGEPQEWDVIVDLNASALGPIGSSGGTSVATATYWIVATGDRFGTHPIELRFSTAEGATATTILNAYLVPPNVALRAVPGTLNAGMLVPDSDQEETQTFVDLVLHNDGAGSSGPLSVLIPSAPWLSVVTPSTMPPLISGGMRSVVLRLKPFVGQQLGDYNGSLVVTDSVNWIQLPFTFTAVSDGVGDLEILAEDEATYWDGANPDGQTPVGPGLGGASVVISQIGSTASAAAGEPLQLSTTTGPDGIAVFTDLPEAFYNLEVRSNNHRTLNSIVRVRCGQLEHISTFLPTNVVTYTWTVEEITIDDEYIFTLEAVFETAVPVPVVTIEPDFVDLTDLGSEITQIDFTIKNEGLIRAEQVSVNFGGNTRFDLDPLISDLGDLEAGQSYVVPVIVTDNEFGGTSAAGATGPCGASGCVNWSLVCGVRRYYGTCAQFATPNDDCGGGGGGGGGGGSGGSGGGGPGSPGNPFVNEPNIVIPPLCEEPPAQDDNEPGSCRPGGVECCESNGGGTGSGGTGDGETDPIYLFSGEFFHEETDLRIRGRGPDFTWSRKYRSKIGPATAQGYGWDYSYNIYLEQDEEALIVHDGNTRSDRYLPQSDGTWARNEYFDIIEADVDDTLSLVFANRGRWEFNPFDGSPHAGKISALVDRNGNAVTFEYDGMGRLWKIRDTLNIEGEDNRVIVVAYNDDGLIESITDFSGRQVTYEYYQDGDEYGSFGDLKSCTSPAVVGTPTGNDFPDGKTRTYTYSQGHTEESLNHNLLTVTDGRRNDATDPTFGEGPYVINSYSSTTDENDRNFDRLVRQIWGGDTVDLVYVPLLPNTSTGNTVIKTIVNDRVGNVSEYEFDIGNRLIRKREYTGRANPTQATGPTPGQNRPINKLRESDPDFYETRYTWNEDSRLIQTVNPDGSVDERIRELAMDPNTPRRSRGNTRAVRSMPGPEGADQAMLEELFEYDDGFGCGSCGFNFVTRHVDARGHETIRDYDENGNLTHIQHRISSIVEDFEYNEFGQMIAHVLPDNGRSHRRRDESVYYTSADDHQNGYLKERIVDAGGIGFGLTSRYEYDLVGTVIRLTDPRGNDMTYSVNALDQVVRELSREVALDSEAGGIVHVRYERDTYFDANNNVTGRDVQNISDTGVLQSNTHFSTLYEYEILDNVVRMSEEVADDHIIVTEHEYDANRNRTITRFGEATNGNQPTNMAATQYDERDRVYRSVQAPGNPDQSSTQYDYDEDANLVAMHEGIEDTPHTTLYTYDGYNRLVTTTDAMGNVTTNEYDENSNVVHVLVAGELVDVDGDVNNVRLSENAFVYDPMNRRTRTEIAFFDTETQNPILDGMAVTETHFTDNSQVWKTVDDRGNSTFTDYDTVNRRETVTDAKGNTVVYGYDDNSNIIAVTETDKSDLGNPDQVFTTLFEFDKLDRQITATDNVDNTNRAYYDSRSNRVRSVDALSHEVRIIYDGLNRQLRTIRDMNDNGAELLALPADSGPDIVTAQVWDDSSRLSAQIDDNGNATTYVHDALNRKAATVYADGTEKRILEFDVHNNAINTIDGNENVVTSTYDDLHRITRKDITVGPGVSDDTTFEVYKYDGLSRLIHAEDDDSIVTRGYDSLSHVTEEIQELHDDSKTFWPPATLTTVFDGVGNQVELHYPSGRLVTTTYDTLNRKKLIADATTDPQNPELIAEYWYVGPVRVEQRDYGNETRTEYTYDGITGIPNPEDDFAVRHIIRTRHSIINATCAADDECPSGNTCETDTGTCIIDDRTYTWDRMSNKTQRKDVRSNGPQLKHDYSYDSIYRMVRSDKSGPNIDTATIEYSLDGVGNRTEVISESNSGVYMMDSSLPELGDQQMNQYTTTPFDRRSYDRNGNQVATGVGDPNGDGIIDLNDWSILDDCIQTQGTGMIEDTCRLVDFDGNGNIDLLDFAKFQHLFGSTSGRSTLLKYDYTNRMTNHTDMKLAIGSAYIYDVLGRRIRKMSSDDVSNETIRFVYAGHQQWQIVEEQDENGTLDATYVFGLYVDEVLNMQREGSDHYYHAEDLYSVVAVTDESGISEERYSFDDYGYPEFFDANGVNVPESGVHNPHLFTGQRMDSLVEGYLFRSRQFDPLSGRFFVRDRIGTWLDVVNLGNAFAYAGNNPATRIDPFGTDSWNYGGGGAGGTLVPGVGGSIDDSSGFVKNTETSEWCEIRVVCVAISAGFDVGLYVGGSGGKIRKGPHCGRALAGREDCKTTSVGLFFLSGYSTDCEGDDSSYYGGTVAFGADFGVSYSESVCRTTVLRCWDTPCDCKK